MCGIFNFFSWERERERLCIKLLNFQGWKYLVVMSVVFDIRLLIECATSEVIIVMIMLMIESSSRYALSLYCENGHNAYKYIIYELIEDLNDKCVLTVPVLLWSSFGLTLRLHEYSFAFFLKLFCVRKMDGFIFFVLVAEIENRTSTWNEKLRVKL